MCVRVCVCLPMDLPPLLRPLLVPFSLLLVWTSGIIIYYLIVDFGLTFYTERNNDACHEPNLGRIVEVNPPIGANQQIKWHVDAQPAPFMCLTNDVPPPTIIDIKLNSTRYLFTSTSHQCCFFEDPSVPLGGLICFLIIFGVLIIYICTFFSACLITQKSADHPVPMNSVSLE